MSFEFRPAVSSDLSQAAALWNQVFGDPVPVVHSFWDLFSAQPGFCAVAMDGDTMAAAAYCLDGLTLHLPEQPERACCYLYAVATAPEYRSHGLAAKLCVLLRDWAFQRRNDCLLTHPAEQSLFPWYAAKVGAAPVMSCQLCAWDLSAQPSAVPVSILSPEEYVILREQLLTGSAHVTPPDTFFQWESLLHAAYGGAFLRVGDGIADVYASQDTVEIQELLLPEKTERTVESAAAAIGSYWNAAHCKAVLPGGEIPFISCAPQDGALPASIETAWFGPVFG